MVEITDALAWLEYRANDHEGDENERLNADRILQEIILLKAALKHSKERCDSCKYHEIKIETEYGVIFSRYIHFCKATEDEQRQIPRDKLCDIGRFVEKK